MIGGDLGSPSSWRLPRGSSDDDRLRSESRTEAWRLNADENLRGGGEVAQAPGSTAERTCRPSGPFAQVLHEGLKDDDPSKVLRRKRARGAGRLVWSRRSRRRRGIFGCGVAARRDRGPRRHRAWRSIAEAAADLLRIGFVRSAPRSTGTTRGRRRVVRSADQGLYDERGLRMQAVENPGFSAIRERSCSAGASHARGVPMFERIMPHILLARRPLGMPLPLRRARRLSGGASRRHLGARLCEGERLAPVPTKRCGPGDRRDDRRGDGAQPLRKKDGLPQPAGRRSLIRIPLWSRGDAAQHVSTVAHGVVWRGSRRVTWVCGSLNTRRRRSRRRERTSARSPPDAPDEDPMVRAASHGHSVTRAARSSTRSSSWFRKKRQQSVTLRRIQVNGAAADRAGEEGRQNRGPRICAASNGGSGRNVS